MAVMTVSFLSSSPFFHVGGGFLMSMSGLLCPDFTMGSGIAEAHHWVDWPAFICSFA